jgi:hypothetical protein
VDLTRRSGRGFGKRNLFQMKAFYLSRSELVQTPAALSLRAPRPFRAAPPYSPFRYRRVMKLPFCALAALVIGCGNGSKSETSGSGSGSGVSAGPEVAAASWKLGGLDVPVTFVPKALGTLPSVLPLKPGAPYRLSDFPEDPPNVEHKLIAGYAGGDAPHDDVIVGYDHLVKVDLLPDLTKAWGAPAPEKKTAGRTSDCWPETHRVKTCWVRFGDQPVWHLQYTSSEVVAAAPAPPPTAKPSATFTDQPRGKGVCGLLGVKEASEIVGVQLAYTEKDDGLCRYGAGNLELAVMERPGAENELNDVHKVEGFADRASWDFVDALVFVLNGKGYRISLLDVSRTSVEVRDVTLQIGRKVLPRLAQKSPGSPASDSLKTGSMPYTGATWPTHSPLQLVVADKI